MVYSIFDTPGMEAVMDEGIRTRVGIEGEYLKRWRTDFQEELDSHNGVSLFVADTLGRGGAGGHRKGALPA